MMIRSVCALALCVLALPANANPRDQLNFDSGWRFAKGDIAGAEQAAADDKSWAAVDLPHDWAIAGPFDRDAPATGSGGFLPTGVAWYRKSFQLGDADRGKRIFIEFDGVMERSGVWINGMHVGHRPNGYSSFRYDITQHARFGGNNVIAVRADTAAQPASRWYAGGGIYRHVRLIKTGAVHVEAYGTYITTPRIAKTDADIRVESSIVNSSDKPVRAYLAVDFLAPDGKRVAQFLGTSETVAPGRSAKLAGSTTMRNPQRWDIADPALYAAVVRIVADDGSVIDEERHLFGIREARFEAATGFWLNGRNIKLKGVAIHADGGPFGMAVPLAFYERRLRGLKALGVNAIRTAHHPFAPEFLDLCDRLGLIVMNEAFDMWSVAKSPQDYHLFFTDWSSIDMRDFVRRDRNHPSVVIWSIGNEIHDTPYPIVAKAIAKRLQDIAHLEDPSRPVTMALFRPNTTGDYKNGLADLLDVVGQNYRENELTAAHREKPTRKIIGTENGKNRANWLPVRDNPAFAGMFLWTGADYLGEADRAGWPAISNPSGLVDRIDNVKPIGWERASWWSDKPVVKLARRVTPVIDTSELPTMVGIAMPQPQGPGALADWTPTDLSPHPEQVEVYSNAPIVELRLNGRSLGRRPRSADDAPRTWTVPFEAGELRAVGYDGQRVVGEDVLRTAGVATKLVLVPEEPRIGSGPDDLGFVAVMAVDAKGVVLPSSTNAVTITVEGEGRLAAYDNGSPTDHTMFDAPTRKLVRGRALAIVRGVGSSGTIRVRATSDGLTPAEAPVRVVATPSPN